MHGTKLRGYCPFPTLGRDTAAGVTTGEVWREHGRLACSHGRAAVHAATGVTTPALAQDMGATHAIDFPWPKVATSIFVSRHGWG